MKSFKNLFITPNNRILFLLFFLLTFSAVSAQRHELGLKLGMSNLVGDIGRTNYVLQKPFNDNLSVVGIPFYGGLIYRMNFNPYQTVRLDVGYNHIQFSDNYAKEQYRKNRGLSGTNSAAEASVVFEYYFRPVNNEQQSMLSPYVFGGVGGLLTNVNRVIFVNDFNRDSADNPLAPTTDDDFVTTEEFESTRKLVMAVPFGAGLKYKFNYNWALSGEFTFRPTFSDAIDYSSIGDKDYKITYNKDITQEGNNRSLLQQEPYATEAKQRAQEYLDARNIGNKNSKDWINSITLGLTYSFGRPPCYCD